MSLLANHALIKYSTPLVVDKVGGYHPGGGGITTLSLTFSRVPQVGELIVIFSGTRTSVTTSTPSGFTLIQTVIQGTSRSSSFYKIATASESATYIVTFSAATDTKQIFGYIIGNINSASPLGAGQNKVSSAVLSPANILNTPVDVSAGNLILFHAHLSNDRIGHALTQNFLVDLQIPSTANCLSWTGYKYFPYDETGQNPSWSWATVGSTAFAINWIEIKPLQFT